jgi:hypothetical protein
MHMLGVVDGDEVQVEPLQPLCLLALLVQKNKNWHLTSTKVQILAPDAFLAQAQKYKY